MLCAHLGRKIMGGNERDYRVAAEVWQEKKKKSITVSVKVGSISLENV